MQFRGISRQALPMEPWGRSVGQALFDDTAAVNRRAVPDQDCAAGHRSPYMRHDSDHVLRMTGVVLAVKVEWSLWGIWR